MLWLKRFKVAVLTVMQVMFNNRKERGELLEELVVSNKDASIPHFSQVMKDFCIMGTPLMISVYLISNFYEDYDITSCAQLLADIWPLAENTSFMG